MGRTIAEELIEQGIERGIEKGIRQGESRGMLKSRQETLIRLLRKRFGQIPEGMIDIILAMTDVRQLDRWLDNLVTARNLTDVGVDMRE